LVEEPLLRVRELHVSYRGEGGRRVVVSNLSFDVRPGGSLGVAGESGSGKSTVVLAILGILGAGAEVEAEELRFLGRDLLTCSAEERRWLRATALGYVSQDPATAFDPLRRLGDQFVEVLQLSGKVSRRVALRRAVEALERVRVPSAAERLHQYPFELSGGTLQRAAIGLALLRDPALIIADEPTTALDASVQASVLEEFRRIRHGSGTAVILVSHDLGVLRHVTDELLVLYSGEPLEHGPTSLVLSKPASPYTRALLTTVLDLEGAPPGQRLRSIGGAVPDPEDRPSGCVFSNRCPLAVAECEDERPRLEPVAAGHLRACRFSVDEVERQLPMEAHVVAGD